MGQHLVRNLLRKGSENIHVVDVKPPAIDILANPRVRFTEWNVALDLSGFEEVLGDANVLFYKVGKLGNPPVSANLAEAWDFLAVNALALANLLPMLKTSQVQTLIVDSSITAVGDFARSTPITESDAAGIPTNPYGVSKAILEDLCALHHDPAGLRLRVVRYPRVYSPEHAGFLVNFANEIANDRPIRLFGGADKVLDLVHIDDAVEVAVSCMEFEGEERVFHAALGRAHTLREIVDMLCRRAGKPDHPVTLVKAGTAPVEPKGMSLADTYTSRKLGIKFGHSLDTMIGNALETAGVQPLPLDTRPGAGF